MLFRLLVFMLFPSIISKDRILILEFSLLFTIRRQIFNCRLLQVIGGALWVNPQFSVLLEKSPRKRGNIS